MTNRLAQMTTAEAADAAARGAVVIFPAGAYEQHGPAMPLATDTIRAEAVTARVADRLGEQVVVGPSLPVGVSPHHLGFAGTVSLSTRTFAAVATEYIDSLARHGFAKFLFVTGHGGNNAVLGTVVQDLLRDRADLEVAWVAVSPLAKEVVAELGVSEVHGHCGEAETAQMLAVAPELVRTELLAPGTTRLAQLEHDAGDRAARLSRRAGIDLGVRWERLSANGVLGDPTTVTAADGERIVAAAVARIGEFVQEWAA